MSICGIIIQYQEDHPGNPGWWRWSRPRHRYVAESNLPPIGEGTRWTYGSEGDALEAQRVWDRQYS